MPDKPKETNGQQPDSSFIQLDDPKQKGAASAASAPRRKALLGVLTAACVVLIVVSLGFVHPSESGAWSIDWIVRLSLRARPGPRIPNLLMIRMTGLGVLTNLTPRKIPSLRTRNRTRTRIARSPAKKEQEIKRLTTVSRLLRIRQRPVGLLPFLITVMPPRATRASLRSLATLP